MSSLIARLSMFLALWGGATVGGSSMCGITPIQPNLKSSSTLIVGGEQAVPHSWPWQAFLCITGYIDMCGNVCGASLVESKFAITAAHCLNGGTSGTTTYRVHLGAFNEDDLANDGMQEMKLEAIYIHPGYLRDPDPLNDIALLEFETDAELNNYVQSVCLPLSDDSFTDETGTAWATGWGSTSDGSLPEMQLHQVELPFVSYEKCLADYPTRIHEEEMLCAGKNGSDTCLGDSGGPLVSQVSGVWYQFGVTSFGDGCGENGHPGVYARVANYCAWLAEVSGRRVSCRQPMV